jgi:porin
MTRSELSFIFLAVIELTCSITPASATDISSSADSSNSLLDRPTLTDNWFGERGAMNEAGVDFRLEWSQFYQGLVQGEGSDPWQYGGKIDALLKLDLSKIGLWSGLSLAAQGDLNYGDNVNYFGGSLIPVNAALLFPGDSGADRSDLMALTLTQNFDDMVSVTVGKINMVEVVRATPLKGGGGVDTFWNTGLALPITGLVPATIFGAMVRFNTQPISFTFFVYDSQDATNRNVFDDPFGNGVTFMANPTLTTSIGGRTGFYSVKGIYSTMKGLNLADIENIFLPPEARDIEAKEGSYYVGLQMQQYLFQDPVNPRRGWGIFGEIGISDGNPDPIAWSGYIGLGGTSLIPDRELDRFGVAYFKYGFSDHLKAGLSPVFNLDNESGVEVFYNWAAMPWLHVTGDIQFIDPGTGDFPKDVFAGVGTTIKF